MSREMLTDEGLLHQYLNGEKRAIDTLLEKYQDRVYTSIYLKVKCRALAQDLMQETFIKVIKTIDSGKYREDGRFYQWMMRISYNLCIDHFRRVKRRPKKIRDDRGTVMERQKDSCRNHEEHWILDEKCQQIKMLVEALPQEQKEVVILRHYSELSFKEIAKLTNVSINTALGRMRYALNNLRKMIEERKMVMH